MAENKVIDTITPSPIPGKEERKNYVVPLIKTDGAEPVGCNVNLKELLDAEATQEELDAKADKIYVDEELKKKANASDMTTALDKKVDKSTYDVEMPKKADKTASELLLMTADTPVFTTDAEGFPVPDGQRAKVHIDKRNLEGDVTVEGKAVGTNVLDFSVEPKDMAEEGIVLKNYIATDTSNATSVSGIFNKYTLFVGDIDAISRLSELRNRKVYSAVTFKPVNDTIQMFRLYDKDNKNSFIEVKEPQLNVAKLYSSITNANELVSDGVHIIIYGEIGNSATYEYSKVTIIDITALSEKYPQYSDEQLKAILDESLPYISAQQSKILGGVITLENQYGNPWKWINYNATTEKVSEEETKISLTANYAESSSPSRNFKNHISYLRTSVRSESDDANAILSIAQGNQIGNGFYGGFKIKGKTQFHAERIAPVAGVYSGVILKSLTTTPNEIFIANKGVAFDMEEPLLYLWLSLNGYSTNEAKAEWCNEHIPPFEGTYDLVLGMKDSLMLKATCGAYTSSVLLKKAVTDIRKKYDIEESGENYVKFTNGMAICWGKYKLGVLTATVPMGGAYIVERSSMYNFPLPFIDIPSVNITFVANEGYCWLVGSEVTKSAITKINIGRATTSAFTPIIDYIAIGRWK